MRPKADFDPKHVAMLYVSIIQGSLMLAKASETNAVLFENIEQFRRYLQSLVWPRRAARPASPPQNRTPIPATNFNRNSLMKIPNQLAPTLVYYTYQLVGIVIRILS